MTQRRPLAGAGALAPMIGLLLMLSAFASSARTVEGRVDLVAGPRQEVAAGEVSEGVVYVLPKAAFTPPRPATFRVDTNSKGFAPATLVVPVGSRVQFPNSDVILHNVFSRTPGSTFDTGFYPGGQVREHTFTRPGLVIVNCSVHHMMRATIVVLGTPFYARPARDGRFRIEGVPEGEATIVYWHPRAAPASVPLGERTTGLGQRMVATKPRNTQGAGR